MSGLAAVLSGRVPPGIYQWHAAFPPKDVQHSVEHAGWQFGYVDGWVAQTKPEFLEAIGLALGFPAHYGRNWDALVDCLREVAPRRGIEQAEFGQEESGLVLLWDGWSTLAVADEIAFRTALSVLEQRAMSSQGASFAVLLRGAGPTLEQFSSLD